MHEPTAPTPAGPPRRGPARHGCHSDGCCTPEQIEAAVTAARAAGWDEWEIEARYGAELPDVDQL